MNILTRKPPTESDLFPIDPTRIYRALQGFAAYDRKGGRPVTVGTGQRLRGTELAVQIRPRFFIDADSTDEEVNDAFHARFPGSFLPNVS